MKILHIISTLDPAFGGPSESVRTLMSFRSLGYEGEAVTADDPAATFLEGLSFPVHAMGPVRGRYSFSPTMYRWVKQNAGRFDVVIVNGLWNFCGVVAWLALGAETPYMVFAHGMLDPYFRRRSRLKHARNWGYWLLVQYWILRKADRVLFTTKEERELAKESFWLHRWKALAVPYGCRQPPRDAEALQQEFYARLPIVKGERFLLFLGRIHRKKGCDLLVRSFLRNAAVDPALHLVMAGPDEYGWSVELKTLVSQTGLSSRVHWPGMLEGGAKWGALYACEVFTLPSHQENFGIAVAEALACGKAVLLADKVNIARQVAEDGAGLLQPDTQEGTDALVSTWIALPSTERKRMELQAAVTFGKRYDMRNTAQTIIALVSELKRERALRAGSRF